MYQLKQYGNASYFVATFCYGLFLVFLGTYGKLYYSVTVLLVGTTLLIPSAFSLLVGQILHLRYQISEKCLISLFCKKHKSHGLKNLRFPQNNSLEQNLRNYQLLQEEMEKVKSHKNNQVMTNLWAFIYSVMVILVFCYIFGYYPSITSFEEVFKQLGYLTLLSGILTKCMFLPISYQSLLNDEKVYKKWIKKYKKYLSS